MVPPLTDEQFKTLLPKWAQVLARLKHPRCPLVVGLPVYNVLYGPLYQGERGVVAYYRDCDDACLLARTHGLTGHVRVDYPCGGGIGSSASLAAYWVPDYDSEKGRGQVDLWLKSIGTTYADLEGAFETRKPLWGVEFYR